MSQHPPSEVPCEPEEDLRTRLNGETSKIAWNELQEFQGHIAYLSVIKFRAP